MGTPNQQDAVLSPAEYWRNTDGAEDRRTVKPGDRDEELYEQHGLTLLTQSRIDSLPVGHKRGMRNVGLLRMAMCRADRRSAECSLLPPESKVTLRDWSSER